LFNKENFMTVVSFDHYCLQLSIANTVDI